MGVETKLVTAEELLHMPEDGYRYELIHGEVLRMPPSGGEHGRVAMTIGSSLRQHVGQNDLGAVYAAETGFKLAANPDHVRAPDVAFVRKARVEQAGRVTGFWPGAPDLAIEVVSPGDSYSDVEEKIIDWLAAGTRMVVVVNPKKRSVSVYRSSTNIAILSDEQTLDGGDVVPGWSIPVRQIFE